MPLLLFSTNVMCVQKHKRSAILLTSKIPAFRGASSNTRLFYVDRKWHPSLLSPCSFSIGDGIHFPLLNRSESDSLLNARHRWMEEGELDAQDQANDAKRESASDTSDVSPAELVNETEVEPQAPSALRNKPDVLAVQEVDLQNSTTL